MIKQKSRYHRRYEFPKTRRPLNQQQVFIAIGSLGALLDVEMDAGEATETLRFRFLNYGPYVVVVARTKVPITTPDRDQPCCY